MNLRQLLQFVTLSETLNFNRTAKILSMAQPPLSVSIRKLETELGAALFTRDQRHVSLTPTGEAVLPAAKLSLFYASQIRDLVATSAFGACGRLRLGIIGTVTFSMLPLIIPAYREKYPRVDVSVMEGSTNEILQYLDHDQLDIGLVRTPILDADQFEIHTLMLDSFCAVVAASSRFAERHSIRLEELKDERFIGYDRRKGQHLHAVMMLACQRAGFQPKIVQEMLQIQAHIALVGSGMGVALVPSEACRAGFDNVKYLAIEDAQPDMGVALVTQAGPKMQTVMKFIELVLSMRDDGLFEAKRPLHQG